MCENLCRICAKGPQNDEALKLFERRHRKLLTQLKEITGIMLKNSIGLPKLICSTCRNSLTEAHQFRENVLKVQASFKIQISKCRRRSKDRDAIEATEFVQVCYVKEEEKESFKGGIDNVEEREMNITEPQVEYKKEEEEYNDYPAEINALELSPNEDSAPEGDNFSEVSLGNGSDIEYKPVSPKNVTLKVDKRRNKQSKSRNKLKEDLKEPDSAKAITKENKPRKRRKDAEDNSNLFICDQCGNHFTCRHHFKLHLRRHTGDKQCACELCPDKFFTSSELRRHMRKHTGERPFACKFCQRRFTDYSTRIKHERTHTNERPFMCSQCGKSFTTSYILKNHMLTHTGERHFKCDVCNKAFTRRTHLVVHFRSIMHKQAVEKDKQAIPQETQQAQRLLDARDIPTF